MPTTHSSMARQVAQAAGAFQLQVTGRAPKEVTAVLDGDMLVITLRGALTPAEQALARDSAGAQQVQEFHRQLFAATADGMRQEIKRITGVEVRDAATQAEANSGTVVHAFASGTMVQVFLLAASVSEERVA